MLESWSVKNGKFIPWSDFVHERSLLTATDKEGATFSQLYNIISLFFFFFESIVIIPNWLYFVNIDNVTLQLSLRYWNWIRSKGTTKCRKTLSTMIVHFWICFIYSDVEVHVRHPMRFGATAQIFGATSSFVTISSFFLGRCCCCCKTFCGDTIDS